MRINIWMLFLITGFVLTSGCVPTSPNANEATPTRFTPKTTFQPIEEQLVISEPTPSYTPEIMIPCAENGKVKRYRIDSEHLNDSLYFSVYFPPCYSEEKADGYPVLYALHGQNFTDAMWIDHGAVDIANRLIQSGESLPFLIVMPYEEYFFRDPDRNYFPSALIDEIGIWIEGALNVCGERLCRAIGGISRGASWAIRIGLSEWDLFGSIGAHSLPTFSDDLENLPDWLDDIPNGKEPRIYLDTGRFDPEVKTAYRFEQILNEKGIPHEWHLNEGRHNEQYWAGNMESYLRWYAEGWE